MVIYLSMILVIFLMYILHQKMYTGKNLFLKNRASKAEALIVFGYIIFWVGIRNGFADTPAYIRLFNSASFSDLYHLDFTLGSDWGFIAVQAIFKTLISSNYHAWLMFLAIISGGCVALTFQKYSVNFFYTAFMFLSLTTFTWMMNGIRQFVAVSILFACTPWLLQGQWKKYVMAVLLCATIHGTCIIMIPIYFIVQGKPWRKKTLFLIGCVLLVFTFTARFTGLLNNLLAETEYSNTVSHFAGDDGVNPLRVAVFAVPTILAFCGRKILAQDNDGMVDIFVNMSILTTLLYAIGVVTSGILIGRLPIYTQLYQYLLLPFVIQRCFTRNSAKIVFLCSICGYMCYFYLMTRGMYYTSTLTGIVAG